MRQHQSAGPRNRRTVAERGPTIELRREQQPTDVDTRDSPGNDRAAQQDGGRDVELSQS